MSDEQTTVAVPPASEEQLLNEQKKKNGSLGSAGEATASWGIAKTAHRLICFFRQFPKSQKNEAAIRLLDAWSEGDDREQHETWEYLKQALDEDRLSSRKLFS